jgi:hypothetical protein
MEEEDSFFQAGFLAEESSVLTVIFLEDMVQEGQRRVFSLNVRAELGI